MPEKYFVRGDSKSQYESMTKEEIFAAITNAIQSGTIGDIDTGFITRLKEINHGERLRFWVGTSAEFNALAEQEENVLYIKTDDTSAQDISNALVEINNWLAQNRTHLANIDIRLTEIDLAWQAAIENLVERRMWAFPEIEAGQKAEQEFSIPESKMVAAGDARNPAVFVSPLLLYQSETYNPLLKYYGYIRDLGTGNGGTLVVGIYNGADTAQVAPALAAVVI